VLDGVLDDDDGTLPSCPADAAQPSPSQPAAQRGVSGTAPAKSGAEVFGASAPHASKVCLAAGGSGAPARICGKSR
jgi:hypothetical protein